MSERIGALHLGWNVLAVAAGGGGVPTLPLKVEGSYTPPAFMLADAAGRLHTQGSAGSGLGLAIPDIRDIVGFPQIVVAGATWPTPEVFRARLHNPLAAIIEHLGGAPEVLALPYPHDWSDEKIDEYCDLVSTLGIEVDPIPESVALAGYVRATEMKALTSLTAVYCDTRTALVVSVHPDVDRPTESVDVPVRGSGKSGSSPANPDRLVYDILAAARSVQAETKTVILTGPACFDDPIREAFHSHLGSRLHIADHPLHAIPLGAIELLLSEQHPSEPEDETPILVAPIPNADTPEPPPEQDITTEPAPDVEDGCPRPPKPTQGDTDEEVPLPAVTLVEPPPADQPPAPPTESHQILTLPKPRPPLAVLNGHPPIATPNPAPLPPPPVKPTPAELLSRHRGTGIVGAALILAGIVIAGMLIAAPKTLTVEQARARVIEAIPTDTLAGLPALTALTVAVRPDIVSLACADIPLTEVEARSVKATASRVFATAAPTGDGVTLRVSYFAPDSVDDVFTEVGKRNLQCPSRDADSLRYIVAVPANGADPGPPRQVGAPHLAGSPALDTANGTRLAWRGLLPGTHSPIHRGQHMTCLLDRHVDLVVRSCGMSLDTRRADTLAQTALTALRGHR